VTPDTSAIVAAFAPWHPLHDPARTALRGETDLVTHVELEAYSVLTRLPAPFRVDPVVAAEYLRRRFGGDRFVLPSTRRRSVVGRLAAAGVAGGKAYDGLIAVTAREAGRELITCDRRAIAVYERLGARFHLVA
jgi:predicted nucleic acid-binding protein